MIEVEIKYSLKILFQILLVTASICAAEINAQSSSKFSTSQILPKSNQNLNDSLDLLIKNGKIKSLSYQQHLAIQKQYDKLDKKIRTTYTDEFLSRNDLLKIENQKAEALLLIGINLEKMGDDFPKAKACYDESYKLFSKLKNQAKMADVLRNIAIYYQSSGEDSTAIQYYTKAQNLSELAKDSLGIVKPYAGFTFMFNKMGLYDKAIAYGKEGIAKAEQYNNQTLIAHISNNTGNAYLNIKDYNTALKMYHRALSINKDTENIIRNCSNIGNAFLQLKNIDSAAVYLNRVERLLPEVDVPRVYIFAYSYLAKLRNAQKRYSESKKYSTQAIEISKTYNLESISEDAHLALVDSYKKLNKADSALIAYENYWEIKKSFLETSRNKTVAQIEQQFQQYKKEKEIEIKAAEIALLKKEQSLSNMMRNGALILVILLSVLAYLYYNRFKLKKKSSDELSMKNIEIENQKEIIQSSLSEKETLLREIHHRVKNNLQIISSLLNIQSNHISDENVLASIHEGQSRVQAMSLIHQNLYQSEHLSNVAIESYLKQLAEYLSGMFAKENKDITINVNAKDINYDIDTAIPLGLIVNELVSNAFKYAFENKNSGVIEISIEPKSEVEYELKVSDNGIGLPENFIAEHSNSLGLKLVKILSRQLRGSFSFYYEEGSVFLVKFKDLRVYNLTQ